MAKTNIDDVVYEICNAKLEDRFSKADLEWVTWFRRGMERENAKTGFNTPTYATLLLTAARTKEQTLTQQKASRHEGLYLAYDDIKTAITGDSIISRIVSERILELVGGDNIDAITTLKRGLEVQKVRSGGELYAPVDHVYLSSFAKQCEGFLKNTASSDDKNKIFSRLADVVLYSLDVLTRAYLDLNSQVDFYQCHDESTKARTEPFIRDTINRILETETYLDGLGASTVFPQLTDNLFYQKMFELLKQKNYRGILISLTRIVDGISINDDDPAKLTGAAFQEKLKGYDLRAVISQPTIDGNKVLEINGLLTTSQ